MRAWIVADLGFGDAGKGTITDALVRRHGARLVVRWNGGALSFSFLSMPYKPAATHAATAR